MKEHLVADTVLCAENGFFLNNNVVTDCEIGHAVPELRKQRSFYYSLPEFFKHEMLQKEKRSKVNKENIFYRRT